MADEISITNLPANTNPQRTDKLSGVKVSDGTACNILVSDLFPARFPEHYGAVGDGQTDDTAALIAWAAANNGLPKNLELWPHKGYVYSGVITLTEFTTLNGNGSVLMRRAGTDLHSTTLTEIAAGAPVGSTVRVADPTKFIIGMDVSFDDGTPNTDINGAATNFSSLTHKITNKVGDTLTLAGAFLDAYAIPVGSVIRMSTGGLNMGGIQCKIRNLIMDGNRDNNLIGASPWGYWMQHYEIYTGVDGVVENCVIKNGQAEGIAGGYNNCIIRNNKITGCAGNGVHLSGSYGTKILHNYFKDNNLLMGPGTCLTETTRHNEGHITFSDAIYDTLIEGNQFLDTDNFGIGSFNTNAEKVTVVNNLFRNCVSGPMQIQAGGKVIDFSHNQLTDCGLFDIDDTSSALAIKWLKLHDNHFDNSAARLDYVDKASVIGNTFNCPLIATPLALTNCSVDSINEHNIVVSS